jgi:hypothetical protein
MGRMGSFFIKIRIKRVERDCQAIGRDVRIIHHRETQYPPSVKMSESMLEIVLFL